MPDISELSSFLKSLADPTRLKIIEYLAREGNPRCVVISNTPKHNENN